MNLSNILNYAESEFRQWQSTSRILKCPQHIEEQSVWRLSQIKENSNECLEKGFCRGCGCLTIDKTFEQDKCALGCYPERMNENDWKIFCKKHNIKIS